MSKSIAERWIDYVKEMTVNRMELVHFDDIYRWLQAQPENQPRSETYTVHYEAAPSPSINANLPNSRLFKLFTLADIRDCVTRMWRMSRKQDYRGEFEYTLQQAWMIEKKFLMERATEIVDERA